MVAAHAKRLNAECSAREPAAKEREGSIVDAATHALARTRSHRLLQPAAKSFVAQGASPLPHHGAGR